MILITGATGKLGSFIVDGLLQKGASPSDLAVLARDPEKAAHYTQRGVDVRKGDYQSPETLKAAFSGVEKLMFVSSSELGARAPSHKNVIAAAKKAGVQHIIYTSILKADISPLELAADHRQSEAALRESGVEYTLLRNGWYFENYTDNLGGTVGHGAVLGAAGDGRISFATRKDYADAAVAVLTSTQPQAGKIYELGGAPSLTLSDLAAEVNAQSGKPIAYVNLSPADYEAKLKEFGVPDFIAHLLADADASAQKGHLATDSPDLEKLIGRKSTSLAEAVKAGLALLK